MRNWLWLCAGMAVLVTGCAGPIKTKEIYFYRQTDVNGGKPVQVDIVYPQTEAEKNEIWQTTADVWFGSHPLFDKVAKEEFDVKPCEGTQMVCSSRKRLEKKTKEQKWMVIIAELGPRPEGQAAAPGQKQIIYLDKEEKPKKKEYLRINQGWVERLKKKPKS